MPKIGVFDSGIGGLSVAKAIQKALPKAEVVFVNDAQHMPYGDKTPPQLLAFVVPILQNLVAQGCEAIVIACNSVTTTLINDLRQVISVPLIGMEPMVKPAAQQTKSGVIAVCATPLTLASDRYRFLKQHYAADVTVLEPECNQWAYMIEHNQVNEAIIRRQINDACEAKADVIVLGCTHYHWIQEMIQQMAANRAIVIQPEGPVIEQLKRILSE